MQDDAGYIGRFAPSPSGPLHAGSLVAAVGSYLEARTRRGRWLLRMEDVDMPRTVPGADQQIIRQLDAHGFEWDGAIMWQSRRLARYRDALEQLKRTRHVFPCGCTRREIADSALARDGSRRYPGVCREGLPAGREARAWRLRTAPGEIAFQDAVQGLCVEDVERDVGDFVLWRADGLFAYQLAVVVDDAEQGVTHVVRGADLLDSTARQILLQRCLGFPTPAHAHLPVATNADGEKLSKQTRAAAIDEHSAAANLTDALRFLGQTPPTGLQHESVAGVWQWAHAHWSLDKVPRTRSVSLDQA